MENTNTTSTQQPVAESSRNARSWQQSRQTLLADMLARGIVAHLSFCVDTRTLAPDWVGRPLTAASLAELKALADAQGFDSCEVLQWC